MKSLIPSLAARALLGAALCIAALPACIVRLGGDGYRNVNSSDEGLHVDGVLLRHSRWVDVEHDFSGIDTLVLHTATGPVELSGAPAGSALLRALVWSEHEGEGEVVIEEGRLRVNPTGAGKVFLNEIGGSVPAGLSLDVATGTAKVSLAGVAHETDLRAVTGTGEIEVTDVSAASIRLETGTAAIRVTGGGSGRLDLDSGTGDVFVVAGKHDKVLIDTGTGDVEITDVSIGRLEFDSGTGDLLLDGGKVENISLSFGTGELTLRNGATVTGQ